MSHLIAPGAEIERAARGAKVGRHHHFAAYAAVVLRGGYLEAGDQGRFLAAPGDVLFHQPFEGHADEFERAGADILNILVPATPGFPLGRIEDVDGLARLAERDAIAAAELLMQQVKPVAAPLFDWPDLLAADLRRAPVRLEAWASDHKLSPSGLSRGFRSAYGLSPKRYRLEQCAASAARAIRSGAALADAAHASGFSDQPHMTRTLRRLWGVTPMTLRSGCKSVQYEGRAAA